MLDCRKKKTPDPVDSECCSGTPISFVSGNESVWLPNAFTPNGDKMNDTYDIYGDNIATLTVQIRNNTNIVYESRALRLSWDGKMNNKVYDNSYFQLQVSGTFSSGRAFSFTGCIALISDCTSNKIKKCIPGDQLTNRGLTGNPSADPCAAL